MAENSESFSSLRLFFLLFVVFFVYYYLQADADFFSSRLLTTFTCDFSTMRQPQAVLQTSRRKLNGFLNSFSQVIHSCAFYLAVATFNKTRFCSHNHFISSCLRRRIIPVGFRISTRPCLGRISQRTLQDNLNQCSRRLMRLTLKSVQRDISYNDT